MADADSQEYTQLQEDFYNDPDKLSQLLGQRVGPSSSFRFTSTTEETVASAIAVVHASDQQHVAATPPPQEPFPPRARDPTPRRAAISARYVKPSLPKHHSAPTVTVIIEERSDAGKMYHSFNDGNAVGDTQPDSQIYKNWTSGLHATCVHDEGHGTSLLHRVEEEEGDTTEDTPFIESSPDLLQSPIITSPTVFHDENNPETQPCANGALTSPLKFETPAMAGRKRDNQGEFLSSAMRTATTPRTALTATGFFPSDMLSAAGNGMSLTQIFNATQAATSPIQGNLHDDAVFQQRSPKFTNARQSSPLAAVSSPISAPKIESALRPSSEPRTEYITMKQSQERRLRETEQQWDAPIEQDSWEELSRLERQRAIRKARERLEDEAAKTLAKVTAPSFSSPAQRKGGRKLLSLSARKKETYSASRTAARLSAYDGPFDDDELQELGQTAAVNGNGIPADGESPEAVSQVVPSREPPTPAIVSNERSSKVQVPRTSSHPQGPVSGRDPDESPSGSPSVPIQQNPQHRKLTPQRSRRVSQLREGGGSFTVIDSQPEHATLSSVPRPSMILPSSPSTNQYSINQAALGGKTGFTSQVISSSMPPMPPQSSSPLSDARVPGEEGLEVQDEAVRSSPPPMNNDEVEDGNEIAYDEHNYDEHLSAGDEEDEGHEPLPDTDVGMDEDNVVPESEHGNDVVDNDEAEAMVVESTVVSNIAAEEGDDEIPETAEQDRPSRNRVEDDELVLSSHPEDTIYYQQTNGFTKPRLQRQSTIPESDMMEDTQPSFSPAAHAGDPNTIESSGLDGAIPMAMAGTILFHTAQEQHSWCGSNDRNGRDTGSNDNAYHTAPVNSNVQGASDENELAQKADPPLFRSLSDIADQPETQRSVDMSSIDFPNLFPEGTENDLQTMTVSGSSPHRPSAKKLKITHSGKRGRFISPAKTPERNPSPSPMGKVTDSPTRPSSSTQGREEAGAASTDNARVVVASATLPSTPTSASKTSMTKTKKSAKSRNKGVLRTVGKEKILKTLAKTTSVLPSMAAAATPPENSLAEMRDSVTAHGTALPGPTTAHGKEDEPVGSPAQPLAEVNNASDRGEEPTGPLTLPNRVFALWPGQGYYPATCLGYDGPNRVRIRYDEGTLNILEVIQVRGLELRTGDQVKVDQPGMKKNVYIVVGLKDKVTVDDGVQTPLTDCRGYKTVVLEVRNRESLPGVHRAEQPTVVTARVEKIYLTNQLCNKFGDRLYNISPPQSPSASTPLVPTPGAAPVLESPSLSRRGLAGPSLLRDSLRAGSVASSYQGGGGTVFFNMAFAITLQHDDDDLEKHALAKLVTSNGGQILDSFSALFNDIEDAEMGPSRPGSADKGHSTSAEQLVSSKLGLRQEYKGLRFAALITDTHSRRSKYIQALALNIPCLHHRWLTDCIAASKPLPFARYLLPAGVSTFLEPGGVVRSRNIPVYDPDSSNLGEVIEKREVLLQNQSVLLITGKSKKDAERKKPYLFLTQALGPRIVGRCADIAAAKTMVQDGKWDWVYVDGGEPGLADAEQALFGHAKRAGSVKSGAVERKKRKRDHSTEPEVLVRVGEVTGKKVRLVCDEFVIQSLILGALIEE